MLSLENIEKIAAEFLTEIGDHWSSEYAIKETDIEEFVRKIEETQECLNYEAKAELNREENSKSDLQPCQIWVEWGDNNLND